MTFAQKLEDFKLENKLEIYDERLSADENIINNNLRIIWDSGNYSFIKNY